MEELSTNLMEIIKEDGVSDLPMRVRGPFSQALRAERQGDNATAEIKLNEAIAKEEISA